MRNSVFHDRRATVIYFGVLPLVVAVWVLLASIV